MLLRAIDDRAHALLQRDVLRVDAVDAGERERLLPRAVDAVVVARVLLEREVGQQIVGSAAEVDLFGDRGFVRGTASPRSYEYVKL